MAAVLRALDTDTSGSAGSVSSGVLTLPADLEGGDKVAIGITSSNTSAITVTTTGWTEVTGSPVVHGSQQTAYFTRTASGTVGQASPEASTNVDYTLATATRVSSGLVALGGVGDAEFAIVSEDDTDTTFAAAQVTPTFDDAYLVYFLCGSFGVGSTGVTDVSPSGEITAQLGAGVLTTNGGGRRPGVWVGTRQLSGGQGVQTNAYTFTLDINLNGAMLLLAYPAADSAEAVGSWLPEIRRLDASGSTGAPTLTQTDATGETAVITGPTSGVFEVEMPDPHTQTLTFDLTATSGAASDTIEVTASPMGTDTELVMVGGAWV